MPSLEKKGCLLIHGFTGGPYELEPLSEYLQRRGWECRVPTLPGHEGQLEHLHDTKYTDWLAAATREAEWMAEKYGTFDLVGFSMGGLIACFLAVRFPVRKLVLLSTAVIYVSPGRLIDFALEQIRHKDMTQVHKIRNTPLSAALQFVKLVRACRPEIRKVKVPALIVQGEMDHIVHPYSASYLQKNLQGHCEVKRFPKSRHRVCQGAEAEQVCEAVYDFLRH